MFLILLLQVKNQLMYEIVRPNVVLDAVKWHLVNE